MKNALSILLTIGLLGCADNQPQQVEKSQFNAITQGMFNEEMARDNLAFIKNQYVKMIGHVDSNTDVTYSSACKTDVVCFPRSEEHNKIFLEKPEKWTNGFYPGLLWKLLKNKQFISGFSESEQALIRDKAVFYQAALTPEAKRGSTHDLGFILYDSFGEALDYEGLTQQQKARYLNTLEQGRNTLVTRFDHNKGVIKSWDFGPTMPAHFYQNGELKKKNMELANPWTYPVIVDNMMNLEFLLSSDVEQHRDVAFSHAAKTLEHHYFYTKDDIAKQYPIAYHLFDYDSMKPGNWQGVGNVSAWARGQGWSLYGYVTVLEAFQSKGSDMPLPDFENHVARLVSSVEKLLQSDVVPDWDFFAANTNAFEIAEDQSDNTVRYSRILDLCDFEIDNDILPYTGYRPIKLDSTLLSQNSLEQLATMTSAYDEPFLQQGGVFPCSSKSYDTNATHIPKDTSAAALLAAALYRLAGLDVTDSLKSQAISLADKIMLKLSKQYLTKFTTNKDYELGFVLAQATGNLPNASEIDTSIVYADFYFLEANVRKLLLTKQN